MKNIFKPIAYTLLITYSIEIIAYFFLQYPPWIIGLLSMWIPGIVALVFSKKERLPLSIFQKPNWLFLQASLYGLLLPLLGMIFSLPFNSLDQDISFLALAKLLPIAMLAGFIPNTPFALGEELFWRGYLHQRLRHLGALKASLIIGPVWGLWHAPVILMGYNYPDHPFLGILFMCLLCTAASPLLFWFRERGASPLIPAILHGTWNAFGGVGLLVFKNPNSLLSTVGLGGILAASILSLLTFFRPKTNPPIAN